MSSRKIRWIGGFVIFGCVCRTTLLILPRLHYYDAMIESHKNIMMTHMDSHHSQRNQTLNQTTQIPLLIDIVSLTIESDFSTLFNSSAMASWIRYIQNIRSITFIGPPSDYSLFLQLMHIHYPYLSQNDSPIPVVWVNETHWMKTYKAKYGCPSPSVCQQLIKLHVFDLRTHLDYDHIGDNILIVDSDTVWSREVTFIHPNKTVTYFERVTKNPSDAACSGMDPIKFTEAISIGMDGEEVSSEDAEAFNHKKTRTPYKFCRRPFYPNATGARHIVHHMLFQYDVMMTLHEMVKDTWSTSSLWQGVQRCNLLEFCKSRVAEYELYYVFLLEHYPERIHLEHLIKGEEWVNGAVCDSTEIECCREKGVVLKGCHNHRIKIFLSDPSNMDSRGDMCCDL